MVVTIDEVKEYLRIDSDDEDITLNLIMGSVEKTCTDILRIEDISDLDSKKNLKLAELYGCAYLWENRETADHNKLNLTLRALLSADRGDSF